MSDYPRERNGWVDDGSLLKASNRQDKCPNCGSSNYRETISMEKCDDCGLVCDYWGEGTNAVYEAMMERDYARRRAEREAEEEAQRREWQEEGDWWQS